MPCTLFASGYGGLIYSLSFDADQGTLVKSASIEAGRAPTWLTQRGKLIYTGDEFAPGKDGKVMVYAIKDDAEQSTLQLLAEKSAGGAGPCHFALSPSNDYLYSANYAGGTLGTIALEQDGTFKKTDRQDEQYKFVGAGPQVSPMMTTHITWHHID
jgi:6-phosphogluconolactonase